MFVVLSEAHDCAAISERRIDGDERCTQASLVGHLSSER